jgi:hypothetical protein
MLWEQVHTTSSTGTTLTPVFREQYEKERGMRSTTVKVADLKKKLKANRKTHRETYEKALKRFSELAVEKFEENIEEIKKGGPVRTYLDLPTPEDHTGDYDTAIEMLDWTVLDEVELTQHEFQQFVLDDWGWKQTFASNTMSYVVSDGNGESSTPKRAAKKRPVKRGKSK